MNLKGLHVFLQATIFSLKAGCCLAYLDFEPHKLLACYLFYHLVAVLNIRLTRKSLFGEVTPWVNPNLLGSNLLYHKLFNFHGNKLIFCENVKKYVINKIQSNNIFDGDVSIS